MHGHISWDEQGQTVFDPVETVSAQPIRVGVYDYEDPVENLALSPVSVSAANTLLEIQIVYDDHALDIRPGEEKRFHAKIINRLHSQQWLECKLHLPEGWSAKPGSNFCLNLNQRHGGCAVTKFDFAVTPEALTQGRYDLLLEIKSNGRLQKLFVELPLLTAM